MSRAGLCAGRLARFSPTIRLAPDVSPGFIFASNRCHSRSHRQGRTIQSTARRKEKHTAYSCQSAGTDFAQRTGRQGGAFSDIAFAF
ncbi:hypothetical protein E4U53_003382, partial [Claviceps sorghi]